MTDFLYAYTGILTLLNFWYLRRVTKRIRKERRADRAAFQKMLYQDRQLKKGVKPSVHPFGDRQHASGGSSASGSNSSGGSASA